MRVYLPATLATLAELARTGELGPAPLRGYAVTGALKAAYADGDEEELEYFAMSLAAADSLELLSTASVPVRRAVIAEIGRASCRERV